MGNRGRRIKINLLAGGQRLLNTKNMKNVNAKTSKELLNELVENYTGGNGTVVEINRDFVSRFDGILDAIDNGSVFRYTLDEISFCGVKGMNRVTIVLSGTRGGIFTKNERFTIVMSDEDKSGCIMSRYLHTNFQFDYETINAAFITGVIDFNSKVYAMKNQMAGNFKKIVGVVKDTIEGTELQIKWCDTDNSKLMISDKEDNDFFLIKGVCIHNGKMEVDGKCCGTFDWGVVDRNFKGDNAHNGFDLFMATNSFCKEICSGK